MKLKLAAFSLFLTLAFGSVCFADAPVLKSGPRKVIPDAYIVVLKPNQKTNEVAKTHGLSPKHVYSYAFNGFSAKVPAPRLLALKKDSRVLFIDEDVEVEALSQTVPTGIKRIETILSPQAKIDGLDDRVNADIAILDTGIEYTHPDLNVIQHVSFSVSNTTGMDGHGHGTHVAGTAAALDNGIGVVGVAPGAGLWAVKVLDDSGSGSLSAIIAGVNYVTQNASQIEVANLSLAGQGPSGSLRLAIQNSVAQGVVYVVAAGNSGFEIYGGDDTFGTFDDMFPSSYPEVMTVSALADTDGQPGGTGPITSYGADDTLATFSNYSKTVVSYNPVTSPGAAIDVAAPGVNIYSTYKNGTYATMSGTSMASPHVAGVVGLYTAKNGRANNAVGVAAIRQALINAAESQSNWGINPTNPKPYLDLNPEGLISASNLSDDPLPPPPANTTPTVSITSPATGSTFSSGTIINFSGSASDIENGNLTPNLIWTSSIGGQIGTGGSFSRSLTTGSHTITATATDSGGATTISSISLNITAPVNNPPTVSILSPSNNSTFTSNTSISFQGSASDTEDGNITSSLIWRSNLDGQIGTGGGFSRVLSSGSHTIAANVTDLAGSTISALVNLTVAAPSDTTPPTVALSISPSASAVSGTVTLSASASDNVGIAGVQFKLDGINLGLEDTSSPYSYLWDTNTSSIGSHTLTAVARDAAGNQSTSNPVTVTVDKPLLTGILTTNKTSYVKGEKATLTVKVSTSTGPVSSASVNLTVTSSNGKKTLFSGTTSSSGVVTFSYSINPNSSGKGIYTTSATASKAGYQSVTTTATFMVG